MPSNVPFGRFSLPVADKAVVDKPVVDRPVVDKAVVDNPVVYKWTIPGASLDIPKSNG